MGDRDGRRREASVVRTFRMVHEGEELLVLSLPVTSVAALSPAEREVARAIARGDTNAEIARARGTSVRTVANQVSSILRRLGAGSRAHVAAKVAFADLGPQAPPDAACPESCATFRTPSFSRRK